MTKKKHIRYVDFEKVEGKPSIDLQRMIEGLQDWHAIGCVDANMIEEIFQKFNERATGVQLNAKGLSLCSKCQPQFKPK